MLPEVCQKERGGVGAGKAIVVLHVVVGTTGTRAAVLPLECFAIGLVQITIQVVSPALGAVWLTSHG
jgi:hypothetical protein